MLQSDAPAKSGCVVLDIPLGKMYNLEKAACEKERLKAQNLARDVAHSEEKYPDIMPTDIMLLSNDITATELADNIRKMALLNP